MAQPESLSPRIFHLDSDHAVSTWRNLVIAVWRGDVSLPRMQDVLELLGRQQVRFAQGVGLWLVFERGSSVPEVEVRAYAAAHLFRFGDGLMFQVASVEEGGAQGALIRSTLRRTISVGSSRPAHVGYRTSEVAAWVSPRLQGVSTAQCFRAAEDVRAALDATPTPVAPSSRFVEIKSRGGVT